MAARASSPSPSSSSIQYEDSSETDSEVVSSTDTPARLAQRSRRGIKEKEKEARSIGDLPEEFYSADFNAADYLKKVIPAEGVEDAWLEQEILKMGMKRETVQKELAQRILQSYDDFVHGMAEIGELGEDLQRTARLCHTGRSNIADAKRSLTDTHLNLLKLHRKTVLLQTVLHHTVNIKQLYDSKKKLQDAIDIDDFPRAIDITLQGLKTLPLFSHFSCLKGMSDTLDDQLIIVEKRLDEALVNVCRSFDADRYEKIITAFRQVGKIYRVHDKMQRYFIQAIQANCQNIVYAHVLQTDSRPELLKRMQYRDLCQNLHSDHFLPCLRHLLEVNCDVMFVHWRISRWHKDYEEKAAAEGGGHRFSEIRNALVEIGKNMWEEAQRRIAIVINSLHLSGFKIDSFLQVLESVNKFIEVGEAFSGTPSRSLAATLTKQSKDHFTNLHLSVLTDVRTLLENEMWIAIPVSENYSARNIPEFQTFLELSPARLQRMREARDTKRSPESVFLEFQERGNPCASKSNTAAASTTTTAAPSEEELDEELAQESIDEEGDRSLQTAKPHIVSDKEVIVSATAINILKSMGKYLYMMQVLQPILPLVLDGLMEIFKLYTYTTYSFFGGLPQLQTSLESSFPILAPRLRKALTSIKQDFVPASPTDTTADGKSQPHSSSASPSSSASSSASSSSSTASSAAATNGSHSYLSRITPAKLNHAVDIKTKQTVFGISERTTGIESLMFIAGALNELKEHLSHLIPKNHLPSLQLFYRDFVDVVPDLQRYLYQILQRMLIRLENMPPLMVKNNWELDDLSSEPDYVSLCSKEFTLFAARLDDSVRRSLVQRHIADSLWLMAVQFCMEQFVEGISRLPTCTGDARALMNLHITQIQNEIRRLTAEPLISEVMKRVEHAVKYVKAFYLQEIELLPFVKDNARHYSSKQLLAIVSQACTKPKVRTELLKQCELALKIPVSASSSSPTVPPLSSSTSSSAMKTGSSSAPPLTTPTAPPAASATTAPKATQDASTTRPKSTPTASSAPAPRTPEPVARTTARPGEARPTMPAGVPIASRVSAPPAPPVRAAQQPAPTPVSPAKLLADASATFSAVFQKRS